MLALAAACLSLATASFMLMDGKPGGAPPKRVADALAAMNGGSSEEIMAPEADTTPFGDGPRVAIALSPQPTAQGAPPSTPPRRRSSDRGIQQEFARSKEPRTQ